MAWKIFAGVLGALVAFWLIVMFVTGAFVIGAGKALDQQVHATLQQDQQRQAQQLQVRQQQQAMDVARRQLGANQRCIGGTVITVTGSSYTQVLGSGGRPVACSGEFAKEALR